MKFTLLTRDTKDYLFDRYSERKESAAELSKRVNQMAIWIEPFVSERWQMRFLSAMQKSFKLLSDQTFAAHAQFSQKEDFLHFAAEIASLILLFLSG